MESPTPAPWRSGIKHDCAAVMELRRQGAGFCNGLGETVELEEDVVFPLLKGSEIAARRCPQRWLLMPQRALGDDPARLQTIAPRAWAYLNRHAARLDARASSIYRGRPRFAIFGVGPYSFAPAKVAIAGLSKTLTFQALGAFEGRPIVLDDTAAFLPCATEDEAHSVAGFLNSGPARAFLSAQIFWDAKRPITIEILRRLDLSALAREVV